VLQATDIRRARDIRIVNNARIDDISASRAELFTTASRGAQLANVG